MRPVRRAQSLADVVDRQASDRPPHAPRPARAHVAREYQESRAVEARAVVDELCRRLRPWARARVFA